MDWYNDMIINAKKAQRNAIIALVRHYNKVWELDYKAGWKLLYERYYNETGHKVEKSKVSKLEQVEAAGGLDILLQIAKSLA